MDYKKEYNLWIESSYVDEKTKKELLDIKDEKEIEDRFYKSLEFGTGGIRGVMGAGSNRMNIYTVAKATQGLAMYLNSKQENASMCVAYDSRNMSKEFATIVAKVLAGNGIKVYIYESLRPVPMLSFATRYKQASGGIVITASHNPKEYNGYKVYGADGAQIAGAAADEILDNINKCHIFNDIKTMELDKAQIENLLVYMGEDVDNAYYDKVEKLVIRKDLVKEKAKDLSIIYTPIHGSGNIPVRTMLSRLGFEKVFVVKEQEQPDGNFPTASYPNPENKDVFNLAIELAKEKSPDLIFGTDPDCDRIGVLVNLGDGQYSVLTGNQVGVLLTDYMLGARLEMGKLKSNDAIIKTIVSTDMVDTICEHYNVQSMDVLTGFKYVGEKIEEFQKTKSHNFVLGFEESYGYLSGDFVRDKDAVIASVLIAEMALYHKTKGKNLYEALQDLYEKYGYYKEDQISIEMKGKDGQEKIKEITSNLRITPPDKIGDKKIVKIDDYEVSKTFDIIFNKTTPIDLPKSNVIKYTLEDESWVVIRPSGTEPKMKIYIAVHSKSQEESNEKLESLKNTASQLVK